MQSDINSEREEVKDTKQQFKQCQVRIVQSQKDGQVHAVLMQQTSQCVPWMRALMVGAAKVLTPVKGHSSGVEAAKRSLSWKENMNTRGLIS